MSLSLAPSATPFVSRKSDSAIASAPHPRLTAKRATAPAGRSTPTCHSSLARRSSLSRSRRSVGRPMFPAASPAMPRLALQSLLLAATIGAAAVFAAGTARAAFSSNGNGATEAGPKNVLGQELSLCSTSPLTGFYRDGYCVTGPMDTGRHTVCAKVTQEFLEYTLRQGNDLISPRPEYQFPGLKEGDGWCLCASRWQEAMVAGVAPPVVLEATHEKTLDYVGLTSLEQHAVSPGTDTQ